MTACMLRARSEGLCALTWVFAALLSARQSQQMLGTWKAADGHFFLRRATLPLPNYKRNTFCVIFLIFCGSRFHARLRAAQSGRGKVETPKRKKQRQDAFAASEGVI